MQKFIDEIVAIGGKKLELTDDNGDTVYVGYEIKNTLGKTDGFEHDFNFLFVSNEFVKNLLNHKTLTRDGSYELIESKVIVNKDESNFVTDEYDNLLFIKSRDRWLMSFDTKEIFIVL